MKKRLILLMSFTSFVPAVQAMLPPAPQTYEQFKEIAVVYPNLQVFNDILPEERVFLYYLYRASLPGNYILADQIHADARAIIDIFYTLVSNKEKLLVLDLPGLDLPVFYQQAECYFVYVWTNHGQYFEKEFVNNKRTPGGLNLSLLTPENLKRVLVALGYPDAERVLASLEKTLVDQTYEPTLTVPDEIEQSAVNIYAKGFTEADYKLLPAAECCKINNYFCFDCPAQGRRTPKAEAYCCSGRCGKELSVVCYWLNRAAIHAKKYPGCFDEHLVKSLEYLIAFFQNGDEELFKQHSIEWLQTASRISYNLGFIEVYKDPKGFRGFFQGDATIRTIGLEELSKVLPSVEQQLPFPQEFKRLEIKQLPNACIGCKVFGTGDLGPLRITSAYCLPNYAEIRAQFGSKQIIYAAQKSLAFSLHAAGYRTLFFPEDRERWLAVNDPECSLLDAIWELHVILHETIGHGSGQSAGHTFKEGEPCTIEGKTYAVGDSIPVTSNNESELLAGYFSTIEELRADIIAVYVALTRLDTLLELGFLKEWASKLSKEELREWIVFSLLQTSLGRLWAQKDKAGVISGDHARADWTIFSYLLQHGCFVCHEQQKAFENAPRTILAIASIDTAKALQTVTELMQEVQRIKSTGDGAAAQKLVDGCCKPMATPHYATIIQDNMKALTGDLKASAALTPLFTPICDSLTGDIVDIAATWPAGIIELAHHEQRLTLAIE